MGREDADHMATDDEGGKSRWPSYPTHPDPREATLADEQDRLVIRNIGLILSGMLEQPVLDGDTIVTEDGKITGIGKQADLDTGNAVLVDAKGTTVARRPPKRMALIGTPSGSSHSRAMTGPWLAGAVKRAFGCAAATSLSGVQSFPRQSMR